MRAPRAVSVLELIVAFVILGIVAALAIPRFSNAAAPPDHETIVRVHLKILRVAIERYRQDHGAYPGQRGDGVHEPGSAAAFEAQLSQHTDELGHASALQDRDHPFGPYLRDGLLPCPVPPHHGQIGVHMINGERVPSFAPEAPRAGWVYNYETGQIIANSDVTDAEGRSFSSY